MNKQELQEAVTSQIEREGVNHVDGSRLITLALLVVSDSIDGLSSSIDGLNGAEGLERVADRLSGIKEEVHEVAARVNEIQSHG